MTEPSGPLMPIPMLLTCPICGERHIDKGEFATKPHHTHACQFCGNVWRPAIEQTVGVQFLPGFKDDASAALDPAELLRKQYLEGALDFYKRSIARCGEDRNDGPNARDLVWLIAYEAAAEALRAEIERRTVKVPTISSGFVILVRSTDGEVVSVRAGLIFDTEEAARRHMLSVSPNRPFTIAPLNYEQPS